jgi:hypothetical protein
MRRQALSLRRVRAHETLVDIGASAGPSDQKQIAVKMTSFHGTSSMSISMIRKLGIAAHVCDQRA